MKKLLVFAVMPVLIGSLVMSAPVFADSSSASGSAGGSVNGGFVQFNNLTVESVSATNAPAEIAATGSSASPTPLPNNCYHYNSENQGTGTPIACPLPPEGSSGSVTPGTIMKVAPYRIEVSSTTELMLRDRTPASLSEFAAGDQINVFGYYNADGSIQAYLVRDISKPIQTQTIQLDNVTLVSVSGTAIPATLAVTQQQSAPCYGFEGNSPSAIACPMGVSSFSANPATANVSTPQALAPMWVMLRKYVVNVDANTIILDRNRTQLSLSNLSSNDMLNIYGETSDNGQTVTADIIRDLSIPATATTYTGTVTQVNPDGSFVIQTSAGQTITVPSPVSVGMSVTVRGVLNSQGALSNLTGLSIGNSTVILPPGSASPTPLLRLKGGTYPSSTSGSVNY